MKYKKQAFCPIKVKDLIEVANLVPFGKEPEQNSDLYKSVHPAELLPEAMAENSLVANIENWIGSLHEFPLLVKFLQNHADFYDMIFLYDHVCEVWALTHSLVRLSEIRREPKKEVNFAKLLPKIRLQSHMEIDESGKLVFSLFAVHNLLLGLDIERFRRCTVCNNVFWAKKLNALACQTKCSKKLYEVQRSKNLKNKTQEARIQREQWKNQDFSPGRT